MTNRILGKIGQFKTAKKQLKNIDNLEIIEIKYKYSDVYEFVIDFNKSRVETVDEDILKESIERNFKSIKKDIKALYKEKIKKLNEEAIEEAYEFLDDKENGTKNISKKKKIWDYIDLER
jgi:hypothetical protein